MFKKLTVALATIFIACTTAFAAGQDEYNFDDWGESDFDALLNEAYVISWLHGGEDMGCGKVDVAARAEFVNKFLKFFRYAIDANATMDDLYSWLSTVTDEHYRNAMQMIAEEGCVSYNENIQSVIDSDKDVEGEFWDVEIYWHPNA